MVIAARVTGVFIAIIALVMGCQAPQPTHAGTGASSADSAGRDNAQAAWPYRPTAMRIHPLTRFAHDEQADEPIIEARIEFTDRDGVTTRAVGQLNLTLLDLEAEGDRSPIRQWQAIDLSNMEMNANRFDTVMRTYLLKLQVDPSRLPKQCVLKSEFTSRDGRVFTATHTLHTPGE